MQFSCKIQSLKTRAIVGLFSWERIKPQELIFNLEYTYSASEATIRDQSLEVPDYTAVAKAMVLFTQREKFQILEALLYQICDFIKTEFPQITMIKISVRKPAALPLSKGPEIFFEKNFN